MRFRPVFHRQGKRWGFGLYWGDASDYKKLHLTVEDDEFAVDLGPFYSWWDRDRE